LLAHIPTSWNQRGRITEETKLLPEFLMSILSSVSVYDFVINFCLETGGIKVHVFVTVDALAD